MATWVDITAAANWLPKYYPVDSADCGASWGAAAASANKFAFAAGEWVGPSLDFDSGLVAAAALPTLQYVGATDVSSVTALRITATVQDDFLLEVGGYQAFLLTACDPADPSPLREYGSSPVPPAARGATLSFGLYSADTELVAESACDVASLAAVTAIVAGRDVDDCGLYAQYTEKALTITKIEVLVSTTPTFWTDFVGCAELP